MKRFFSYSFVHPGARRTINRFTQAFLLLSFLHFFILLRSTTTLFFHDQSFHPSVSFFFSSLVSSFLHSTTTLFFLLPWYTLGWTFIFKVAVPSRSRKTGYAVRDVILGGFRLSARFLRYPRVTVRDLARGILELCGGCRRGR